MNTDEEPYSVNDPAPIIFLNSGFRACARSRTVVFGSNDLHFTHESPKFICKTLHGSNFIIPVDKTDLLINRKLPQ